MSGPTTITRRHLDRLALIYVRQSTLMQVRDHNRVHLAPICAEPGRDATRLAGVADRDDRHRSGAVGTQRDEARGLQRIGAPRLCGEVGAIFGLEILAPRAQLRGPPALLEFCSLTETLIVDADGIYDLQNFNDRLLLGLKSTMSEASCTFSRVDCRSRSARPLDAAICDVRCRWATSMMTRATRSWIPTRKIRAAVAGRLHRL